MVTKQPLVSIVINCFNGEKYLKKAIDSVISQSYQNWEIIFWDNQSKDRSAEIFLSYQDKRLKYYYAESHESLYGARNQALEKVDGELIAFLDVDDFWESNKLISQVYLFDNPKVGISCGNFWIRNELTGVTRLAFRRRMPSGMALKNLLSCYSVGILTLVVRRAILDRMEQVFDPAYSIIGDFDFVVKIARKGWLLASVQEPIATYRVHGDGQTKKSFGLHELELKNWTAIKEKEGLRAWNGQYKYLHNSLNYVTAMNYLKSGNKIAAFKVASQMPIGIYKIRIMAIIIAPNMVFRHFKN
jgi:glycosyltransferase involved in cell wall biosynthesis